ncbi:unnamed protein product [Adineta steineri]|uniref:Multifunctional fusion protein n=1 Tax=Adineta steineri TaxID=433720 RepID=A0A818SEC1_9BILA|nr:unnamed protein product [Adineta steineri]
MWLDESMDETSKDYEHTLMQIQTITDDVNIFQQRDECIDFLSNTQDIKFFLIVGNTLAQQIMPLINDIPQLDSVYILSNTVSVHKEWTKEWSKIKSIHINTSGLCQVLQLGIKQCSQDSIAVSFVTMDDMKSIGNLNQLEPTFMYTQIFKDIILHMEHSEQAITEFITYCRHNNCVSARNIDRFEKEYQAQLSIWWYTFPSNIYSMLNHGLRTLDADIIITTGFFISHLHQQIQQLYEEQANTYGTDIFIVYRGQGFMKSDFEKLEKTKGGLISFNNFLSTSKDKDISLGFAQGALENENMVGILFIISVDPCVNSVPFAFIKGVSYYNEEDEMLFSMHTVFRVGVIKQMDNDNQLYQVELQLTSDDDQQLRLLTDRIRDEATGSNGWRRLGNLLLKIGQFNKAEELYSALLAQTSNEGEKAHYYHQLGSVHLYQGEYKKAIWYYEQALGIWQNILPSNHPDLASSYNSIGNVYNQMADYSKAVSLLEQALEIQQKTLPPSHVDLANSYNNIAAMYKNMGEYSKALSYYEKALEIRRKSLPSNHPDLATTYSSIGMVYNNMGEYPKALSLFEQALEIYQKTLPLHHPDLAYSYNNIALVYKNVGEYSKAVSLFEQALDIYQKSLPLHHPYLATLYNNIGDVYKNMEEYSKALLFYEKALVIREKTLPLNHHNLTISYNNVALASKNMGVYSKTDSLPEQALEIDQETHSFSSGQ